MSVETHLPVMSGRAESGRPSPRSEIDRAVVELDQAAAAFAAAGPAERAAVLRSCIPLIRDTSAAWVALGCEVKGISAGSILAGEEWVSGPFITIRSARLHAEALEAVARRGRPPLGTGSRIRGDGRLEIDVFPASALERILWQGYTACVLMEPGIDEAGARERQAWLYSSERPHPRICAVLGAGNVSSIAPQDVFEKLFVEGALCVLKMNPVNEWLGPVLEECLGPLIAAGWLRIVYGGAGEGTELIQHPLVDDIHITGSANTFDAILWGPGGEARERRKKAGDRVLRKTITAELGNVSPLIVVPAGYSEKELVVLARAAATQVGNNASFNCNATKLLVLAAGWPQRDVFMGLVGKALGEMETRRAYYPGAFDRYQELLAGHSRVERFGSPGEGELAWALVRDLDPDDGDEPLFQVEPFCGILSETALEADGAVDFLEKAVHFCNDKLWGTLNASIATHPSHDKDAVFSATLERATADLRYGTVGINVWPAVGFALASVPWGGHPSARPEDIQSGLGWVHNPYMLGGIDKSIVRGPLVPMLKPTWSYDHRTVHKLGPKLVDLEASPSWLKVPAITATALRG